MYAVAFILFALTMAAAGAAWGGWRWLLMWPALSFGLVAAGYVGIGPRVFGKQPNGRLLWWRALLLLPFLVFTWTVWHVARLVSREPAFNEIRPALWLGRRLLAGELPEHVRIVVDLTCEFPEPKAISGQAEYVCLPTLDTTAPRREDLLGLLGRLRDVPDTIYVHCASGHGRAAVVAAAFLLVRGQAANAKEALGMVRKARPGVCLHPAQYRLLESIQDAARN